MKKTRDLILVRWEDCTILSENWTELAEVMDDLRDLRRDNHTVFTAGILLDDCPQGLTVASDYNVWSTRVGFTQFIPRSQIKSVRKLGKVKL